MIIEQVMTAIENLNEELYLKLEPLKDYEEGSLEFIFRSDGGTIIVEFLGFDLWNSESDEREEICGSCAQIISVSECTGTETIYEPIENFLRQEANKRLQMIKNLHFTEANDYYKN